MVRDNTNIVNPAHATQYATDLPDDYVVEKNSELQMVAATYSNDGKTYTTSVSSIGSAIFKFATDFSGSLGYVYNDYIYNGGSFANLFNVSKSVDEYGSMAMETNDLVDLEYIFQLPKFKKTTDGKLTKMTETDFLKMKVYVQGRLNSYFYKSRSGGLNPTSAVGSFDSSTGVRSPIYLTTSYLQNIDDGTGRGTGNTYMVEAWIEGFEFDYGHGTILINFKHKSYAISAIPFSVNLSPKKSGGKITSTVDIANNPKVRIEGFYYKKSNAVYTDLLSQYQISELSEGGSITRTFTGAQMGITNDRDFVLATRLGDSEVDTKSWFALTPEQIAQAGNLNGSGAKIGAHASGMPDIINGSFSITTNDRWTAFRTKKSDITTSVATNGTTNGVLKVDNKNGGIIWRVYNQYISSSKLYNQVSRIKSMVSGQLDMNNPTTEGRANFSGLLGPQGESAYFTLSGGRESRFNYNRFTKNRHLSDSIEFVYLATNNAIRGIRVRTKKNIGTLGVGVSIDHPTMAFGSKDGNYSIASSASYVRVSGGAPTSFSFITVLSQPTDDDKNKGLASNLINVDFFDTDINIPINEGFLGAVPLIDFYNNTKIRTAFNLSSQTLSGLSINGAESLDAIPDDYVNDNAHPAVVVYRKILEL